MILGRRWTDQLIDAELARQARPIFRNQSVVGIQPSVAQVEWKCIQDHTWRTTWDSIRRGSGCPTCAGNLPWTLEAIQVRLDALQLNLEALEMSAGHYEPSKKHSVEGKLLIRCRACKFEGWNTRSNVLSKFQGCPNCNTNTSKRVCLDGIVFRSRFEGYCYERLKVRTTELGLELLLQQRWQLLTRHTCDFVIPSLNLWIEASGTMMLKKDRYASNIQFKKELAAQLDRTFVCISTVKELTDFIESLRSPHDSNSN